MPTNKLEDYLEGSQKGFKQDQEDCASQYISNVSSIVILDV